MTRLSPKTLKRIKAIEQRNRSRARKMGRAAEPVDFVAICEGAGWLCWICGEAIDPELAVTQPLRDSMALSLEHFPALGCGGRHDVRHVRPAHLSCNLRKGSAEDTGRAAKAKRQARETGRQRPNKRARKIRSAGFQTNRGGPFKQTLPSKKNPGARTIRRDR